jgi:hypothetical protein
MPKLNETSRGTASTCTHLKYRIACPLVLEEEGNELPELASIPK